jgi:hypothetical protein
LVAAQGRAVSLHASLTRRHQLKHPTPKSKQPVNNNQRHNQHSTACLNSGDGPGQAFGGLNQAPYPIRNLKHQIEEDQRSQAVVFEGLVQLTLGTGRKGPCQCTRGAFKAKEIVQKTVEVPSQAQVFSDHSVRRQNEGRDHNSHTGHQNEQMDVPSPESSMPASQNMFGPAHLPTSTLLPFSCPSHGPIPSHPFIVQVLISTEWPGRSPSCPQNTCINVPFRHRIALWS